MPNWVDNVMIIKANPKTLAELRTKIKTDTRDDTEQYFQICKSLYPMPNELKYVLGSNRDDLKYVKVHDKVVRPPEDWYYKDGNIVSDKFPETNFEVVQLTEPEKKALEANHGATNWYDWNVANYGSKWGDCYTHAQTVHNGNLLFQFESAWSPLVTLAKRISEDYKCKVVIKYSSIDNADKGEIRFNKGTCYFDKWELWDYMGMLEEE